MCKLFEETSTSVLPVFCNRGFMRITGLGGADPICRTYEGSGRETHLELSTGIIYKHPFIALNVSLQAYKLLMETSRTVQPISCDEAFMDITGLGHPDQIVRDLRARIVTATGINASAGIGPNMLLARLATKRAKPNGQFNINPSQVNKMVLVLNPCDMMTRL